MTTDDYDDTFWWDFTGDSTFSGGEYSITLGQQGKETVNDPKVFDISIWKINPRTRMGDHVADIWLSRDQLKAMRDALVKRLG